ncbi:hypothetical protein M405DRAFT_863491 [Rhizopogon salebrosus TDB-379]|nr:hypothetical protein M405DRAFT_863491 [Rhizopogon salebrosus TDB-379]
MPPSTSSVPSDRDSLKSTAQAFLECLDQQDHRGRLNNTIEGITRICLREILSNCQSQVTMWDEGSWKYKNIDPQAFPVAKPQTPVAPIMKWMLNRSTSIHLNRSMARALRPHLALQSATKSRTSL